jgi:hypothetical protein
LSFEHGEYDWVLIVNNNGCLLADIKNLTPTSLALESDRAANTSKKLLAAEY